MGIYGNHKGKLMCILHGDYHDLRQECFNAIADHYFLRDVEGMTLEQIRDDYQSQVERMMLDAHIRAHKASQEIGQPQ